MSQRYFIRFSYDGSNYHGWQLQPNGVSVQEVMANRLQQLFGPETTITAAGRTDAGVHAKIMVAHFDAPESVDNLLELTRKLDIMMPADITILQIVAVQNDAHARFDANSRTYEYWIGFHKDPFHRKFFKRLHRPLDFEAMNRVAKILFEYEDYTCFSKVKTDVKNPLCRIKQAYWEQRDGFWVFTIQSDRFLRNMVRAIVGTLIEVGSGKLDEAGFRRIIESKNRCEAGMSVDAHGLFLTDVTYPDRIFIK